jgi:hypothetical protein
MKGVDVMELTRGYLEQIEAFEQRHERKHPWIVPP